MARRMADPGFRQEQEDHRYDEHVQAINELVDDLRARHSPAFVPYVAPHHGGREARVLTLFRAPSPGTNPDEGGTGFVSVENDDASAQRHLGLLEAAGIDSWLVLPWNAVPYQLPDDQPLGTTEIKAGRAALAALVPLLPRLRSVVLHGREVEPVWAAYAAANPSALVGVRVEPVTFSTGDRALLQHRASRERRLAATYASVADALR